MFAANLLKRRTLLINRPKLVSAARSMAKFKDGGDHATFNDMPIPQGSWQEANTAKQNRYMIIFVSGLSALVASILWGTQSGYVAWNYTVPDYPYTDDAEK